MSERITLTIEDGVADLRLNRPDKMNALDPAMFDALLDVTGQLASRADVRAVVLSGEGRAFCSGLDMASMAGLASGDPKAVAGINPDLNPARLRERTHGLANAYQQVAWAWHQLPMPVIAALHGVAYGGGLQIALGADIRLVSADLKMSVMEIRWGIVPDMAGMVLMRGLLRPDVMRELVYTGRTVSGAEAVQLGLATRLCSDPLNDARLLARQIASHSPDAICAAKRLLNRAADAPAAEVLLAESVEQQRLLGQPNQIEAVRAGFEKRAPRFDNRSGS
ncbi:crotonase/enoyl-CoA hydratase family protein [Piscinibacter sakaiensis]|uniref:crotonase/enoyl-CoA hydratase family protein n=1 Tax=Piscinibacter sakaiensis TaxID=1547922 RepID=UPI003AAAC77B